MESQRPVNFSTASNVGETSTCSAQLGRYAFLEYPWGHTRELLPCIIISLYPWKELDSLTVEE